MYKPRRREEEQKKNFVTSMNRYGKPRNVNYMVNVCDDVVLFKHTQGHSEENKQNVQNMVQMT